MEPAMGASMNWIDLVTVIGTGVAVLGILITWMAGRFNKIDEHVLEAHKRIDAAHARMDQNMTAMNARLDTTQSIIMRMLEKQGR